MQTHGWMCNLSVLVNQNRIKHGAIHETLLFFSTDNNYVDLDGILWHKRFWQNTAKKQLKWKTTSSHSNVYIRMCQVSTKLLLIVLVGQGDWESYRASGIHRSKREWFLTSRIHQGSRVRMRQALSASPCSPSVKHVETQTLQSHEEEKQDCLARCTPIGFSEKSGRMTSGRWTSTLCQNKNCRSYIRAALKDA